MISSVVVSPRERRSEHGSGAPDPDGGGGAPRGGRGGGARGTRGDSAAGAVGTETAQTARRRGRRAETARGDPARRDGARSAPSLAVPGSDFQHGRTTERPRLIRQISF